MTSESPATTTATLSSLFPRDFAKRQDANKQGSDALPPAPIHVPDPLQNAGDDPDGDAEELPEKAAAESEMVDGRPRDVYDRFTRSQKRRIVAIVSYSAFISPMASSAFLPSIPQMAQDLGTTDAVINYTVAVFIVVIGIAPLIWSPMAGFYGRRPIYLASMPIMVIASIGVAESRTVTQIIATRVLQGIGSSSPLAVGAGVVGDIFRPTERANAMGWFYSGALLGPSLCPVIAGLLTEYTAMTWRSVQFFLAGAAALSFCLSFLFLPETHHDPLPHDELCQERGKRFVPYIFNPLSILGLFRWPNICALTAISSGALLETYCLLVPLSTVFQTQYGITNVAVSGCLFLASGGGNLLGSRVSGPWADRMTKRWIVKRGHRRPEDRLRAALLGIGVLLPCSCLAYGWVLQFQAGGLAPPLIFLIINGFGLMLTFTPLNTYAVDSMQTRAAEVIAVNNFVRYVFSAAASAFVLPMANAIGWGWTMTFAAFLVWGCAGLVLLLIRYGHVWREAANKRYGYVVQGKDEQHGPNDEETGDADAERSSQDSHHGEKHDQPGDLVTRPAKGVASAGVGGGAARPQISRIATRSSVPDVETVLKRTISLSGASVHGGG